MEFGIFGFLIASLVYGLKHALEPDHVIGVATVSSKEHNMSGALKSALYWGLGHTITIGLVTLVIFLIGNLALAESSIFTWFERGVGIMLIVLGIKTLMDVASGKQVHTHDHDGEPHTHQLKGRTTLQSVIIGGIHGLAGSGAVVVGMGATLDSVSQYISYIALFGAGSILGMMIATGVISIPMITSQTLTGKSDSTARITRYVVIAAGIISILFGLYLLWELR